MKATVTLSSGSSFTISWHALFRWTMGTDGRLGTDKAAASFSGLHGVRSACKMPRRSTRSGQELSMRKICERLGYELVLISMFKDMTTGDLLEHRFTRDNGDTAWRQSALVQAARNGQIAVLDGIERLHPATLSSLQSLICDRVPLPSGGMLLESARSIGLQKHLGLRSQRRGSMYRIDPRCIIAIGCPPSYQGNWAGLGSPQR